MLSRYINFYIYNDGTGISHPIPSQAGMGRDGTRDQDLTTGRDVGPRLDHGTGHGTDLHGTGPDLRGTGYPVPAPRSAYTKQTTASCQSVTQQLIGSCLNISTNI